MERVACFDGEVAGVSGLAVGTRQAEDHGIPFHRTLPLLEAEASSTTVQVMRRDVGVEFVGRAIHGEPGIGHPIGVATDQAVEVRVGSGVRGDGRAAEQDVGEVALPVGHLDAGDDAAVF